MGRAKLALVPINKERYKKTTFQKRKAGLFKKAYEFSTLCGVDACVIVYGPQPNSAPVEADTWPPDLHEVRRILRRSAGKCRGKHTQDLSDFLQTRKKKIEREVAKQRIKNWRAQYPAWDPSLDGLSEAQLRQFLAVLDAKLERVKHLRTGRPNEMMTRFDNDRNNCYYSGNDFYNTDYMKAIQCVPPRHDYDCYGNGNSFQYYASEMGVYNGDSFQYGSSNGSNNLQSYTALLGGCGDGVSSNGNFFGFYTMINGGDVGSSSGNEESKSLVYYDSVSNQ